MSNVTGACIQKFNLKHNTRERSSLIWLANEILELMPDVRFFNTDDKKPYDVDNEHAVSLEGALIWQLPDKKMLEIKCRIALDKCAKYEAYLYDSHKEWCDAQETYEFPISTWLVNNEQVINYLKTLYPDM